MRLAFDSNKDGVLNALDTDFAKFGVWQDANSDGVTDPGEFTSLTYAGIASINLTGQGPGYSAAGGEVFVHAESQFTYQDGSTGLVGDVSLALGAVPTAPSIDSSHIMRFAPTVSPDLESGPTISELVINSPQTVDHLLPTSTENSASIVNTTNAQTPAPVSVEAPSMAASESGGSVEHISHDAIEPLDDAPAAVV